MRGRTRTIKPELFADEQLGDLEQETGLPIFRAFVGLLVFADREGRFRWAPRALKGAIAPCWGGNFAKALEALASKLFVIRYTVNGEDFGFVRNFRKHQTIHPKEASSTLPPPPDEDQSALPGNSGKLPEASRECRGEIGSPTGDTDLAPSRSSLEVEVEETQNARASTGATPLQRERKGNSGHSRPARVFTMPCEEPPPDFLDAAVMAGVSRAQAASTWGHYWAAGLPERGVEKLIPWLVKQAKERANQTARVEPRAGPDDSLRKQADRVQMLREQEAEEERRRAAGVSS